MLIARFLVKINRKKLRFKTEKLFGLKPKKTSVIDDFSLYTLFIKVFFEINFLFKINRKYKMKFLVKNEITQIISVIISLLKTR